MSVNFIALKSELINDPNNYGYASLIQQGNDVALSDMINMPRDGTNGGPAISVKRSDISPNEVLEAIDTRDFIVSPAALQVSWFESTTQLRTIRLLNEDNSNTRALRNLKDVLITADTRGSIARLNAISVKVGTRAEQLFGTGTFISDTDIGRALVS